MFFIIGVLKNFTNFTGKHQCWSIFRSSCSQVFFKVGVLKNFTRFTEKHLCRSLFLSLFFSLKAYNFNKKRLDKVGGLKVCNFNKKRLLHRCFPVNIAKFLRAALFIEFLRQLLLYLFNKVAGLKTSNFIKKRLQHRCFPVKFAKVLRITF